MTDALYPGRDEPVKMEREEQKEREGQRNKPKTLYNQPTNAGTPPLFSTRSHWSRLDCNSNLICRRVLAALVFIQLI